MAKAEAYDGRIIVDSLGIDDLTGIEAFTPIDTLDCSFNHLDSLDVGSNTALVYLDCSNSDDFLVSLNVSSNPALMAFYCNGVGLSSLNIQNGNNPNMDSFNASDNPNPTCIQVYDPAWATEHWNNYIDPIATSVPIAPIAFQQ